jgi:hypothetical protein
MGMELQFGKMKSSVNVINTTEHSKIVKVEIFVTHVSPQLK